MAEVTNGNKLINYQNLVDFKEQIDKHYSSTAHTHSGYASSTHGHGNITSAGTIAGAASKVVVTDSNGKITSSSNITTTKLGYLSDVTGNIQTQLDGKASTAHTTVTATTSTLGHVKLTTGNCSNTYTAGIAAASKHSHSDATTGASGYMSADDKKKLDGIATGADAVGVTAHTNGTKIATISINGNNTEIKVSASDLGVSNALQFIGEATTTAPTAGNYKSFTHGTTKLYIRVTTSGTLTEVNMLAGDVFIYSGKEFICTTSGKDGTNVCKEFGDEGSYALKTYKVTGTTDLEGGGTLTGTTQIKHKEVLGTAKTSIGGVSDGTITVPIISANKYGHITALTTSTTITPTTSAFTTFKVGTTSVVADTKHDTLTLSAGTHVTITADATNDKITISSTDTNDYHKPVYTTGTKIATGVTNEDIFVPVATTGIAGTIKIGYTENGKNYPVELDTNGNAFVNVPWTDTDTNTHYTSKNVVCASATGTANAAATNGNVHLNHLEESTVKSSNKISGAGATTVTCDANGNIIISSTDTNTNDYHRPVYTTGTKIATGVTNQDIYVPVATTGIAGTIKVGYTENGKNYPVELDANGNAYVNVPWTDTDTNTDNWYTNKLIATSSSTSTGIATASSVAYLNNLVYDKSGVLSGLSSYIQVTGAGAAKVSVISGGIVRISATPNYTTGLYVTTGTTTGNTNHGCGSDGSTHDTVDMKLFDNTTLRNTVSFSGSNICLNAVKTNDALTTISMWAPGCTKSEIDALFD